MDPNGHLFPMFKQFLPIFLCIAIIFELKQASTEVARQLPEDNSCAKFTLQFLEEFSEQNSSSSLFGWITAEGDFTLGRQNGTHLTIQCLALALSDWDFLVDRKCLMLLTPNTRQRFYASQWHRHKNASDDGTAEYGQNVTYVGPISDDLHSVQLINFVPKRPPSTHPTPRPCIFPIGEQLASNMHWNGTICGLKNTADQTMGSNHSADSRSSAPEIICHPIELQLENGKMGDTDAFRLLHTVQLRERTPLFFFDETVPNNTYLRAVGTLNDSIRFFNKNDCERLAINSDDRVQCAENHSNCSIRPFTQEDANAAFLMAPLVILSVLITTGMLITLISFIVQHKRQISYNAIN